MGQKDTKDALDYMHIGASRAASCWVWENIKTHPELHNPTGKKNVRFWNGDTEKARSRIKKIKPLKWYKKTYQRIPGKLNIDMTDSNSWIPREQIQQVFENYPDVKISYCFRNPVDVMWSHTHRKIDKKSTLKFMKEVATCRKIKKIKKVAKMVKGQLLPYRSNVSYRQNYKNWSQYTDIHPILFDDIKNNPQEVLISIADFIGIDNTFWNKAVRSKQANKATNKTNDKAKINIQYAQVLIDELADEITFMEELFDRDFSHWRLVENYDTATYKRSGKRAKNNR